MYFVYVVILSRTNDIDTECSYCLCWCTGCFAL